MDEHIDSAHSELGFDVSREESIRGV